MTDDDMTSDAQTTESAEATHDPHGGVGAASQEAAEPGAPRADRSRDGAPSANGAGSRTTADAPTPSSSAALERTPAEQAPPPVQASPESSTARDEGALADGAPLQSVPPPEGAAEGGALTVASSSASERQLADQAPRARNRLRLAAAALAASCLGLLVLVGYLGYALHVHNRIEDRRAAVLNAARQEAVNFITIDYNNLDRDFANVLGLATGEFEQQFAANRDQLQDLLRKNQTVSTGEVRDAGIVTVNDNTARVIAIVDSTVSNTAAPNGSPRFYRLQMDLDKVNGRWLVSQLEFVGG